MTKNIAARNQRLHRESLLNIPLVSQMFEDPGFKIIRRGIDARWHYAEQIASRIDGFNPMVNAVLIADNSYFDKWLPHKNKSARKYNSKDGLMSEVMFAVHDYLHAWSYRWINELCPELGFGTAPITRKNFEIFVFCHLLTEAVATVGLDYWYLSCVDINEVVPIGTTTRGLTVSYREAFSAEYERFSPGLKAQAPEFLETITRFYCDGVFHGFSVRDLKLSPVIHQWLKHELQYGKKQREYSREWFAYLSKGAVKIKQADLGKPIKHNGSLQKKLMRQMSHLLWAKVKDNDLVESSFSFSPEQIWTSPIYADHEYQFTNLNRTRRPSKAWEQKMSDISFSCLLRQYISGFDFDKFPEDARAVFEILQQQRSLSLGNTLLRDFARIPKSSKEPRDVFMYN